MYMNGRFNWRHRLVFIWLALAMTILPACSLINRGPVLGNEVEFQPQAQVTTSCNTTCSQHGQCGITAEGNQVILGGQNDPMVANQDRIFPSGTAVTILAISTQTIETVQGHVQSPLLFYQIQPQDERQPLWVAGWCLAAQ
jgi:3D (Asp-Asp-Asp) domain-containing protein